MDFFTTHDAPVAVNIDGTAYSLPRFLMPALKAWAAQIRKELEDAALAQFGDKPDERARFLTYFQPPPIDIADLLGRVYSPEGAEHIVDAQLRAAGVPDDIRTKMIAQAPPLMLRTLALELTKAAEVLKKLGVDEKEKADPLPPSPEESGGSPGTGNKTEADSTPATAT